jgi:phage gp46-like protein
MAIDLSYDNDEQLADLVVDGTLLGTDEGLEPAVIISLFTDRRATEQELANPEERRGWWGDTYPDVEGDQIGSKLWLLARAKTTTRTLRLAEVYTKEALQWLLDDGVAIDVTAEAFYNDRKVLCITVGIQRPGEPAAKWIRTWEAT